MTLKPVLNMSVPEIIIDFGVANKIDDQLLQGLLDKVNELKYQKKK